MSKLRLLLVLALLCPTVVGAQHDGEGAHAHPYAGLETRQIKSLSEEDILELRRGGGWELALPAELNGKPGPAHLLELKDEIGLTDAQVAEITAIFEEMQSDAIRAGELLISAEAELSNAFETEDLSPAKLESLISVAAAARSNLRFIHLSRHLETVPLLSTRQIERYRELRGYTSDPCSNIPDGHDPTMWKKHNGCS